MSEKKNRRFSWGRSLSKLEDTGEVHASSRRQLKKAVKAASIKNLVDQHESAQQQHAAAASPSKEELLRQGRKPLTDDHKLHHGGLGRSRSASTSSRRRRSGRGRR